MKFIIENKEYRLKQVINNVLESIIDESGNMFYLKRFGFKYNSAFNLLDTNKNIIKTNIKVICC